MKLKCCLQIKLITALSETACRVVDACIFRNAMLLTAADGVMIGRYHGPQFVVSAGHLQCVPISLVAEIWSYVASEVSQNMSIAPCSSSTAAPRLPE